MRDVVFITFDIKKDEYPPIPYSIASMIAALKKAGQHVAQYSVDTQHVMEEKERDVDLTVKVTELMSDNLDYFKKFRFIALGLTAWSLEFCEELLNLLHDYTGKIIMGGYEVTALQNDILIKRYPRVDYFIKGYAENALLDLVVRNENPSSKILLRPVAGEDIVSPYQQGVIAPFSKKIYWETKRGCQFKCGFCEWGNATLQVKDLYDEMLEKDIAIFKESAVEEINILDGTFNHGKTYLKYFRQLLEIEDVKITCQARFENLFAPEGKEFLDLCSKHKHRVHLEFGLQTIHPQEMVTIGRKNSMSHVKEALDLLRDNGIDYETSIIYAIPGQTVESFIDSIEFLIINGCKTIRAYPLRIPKNSEMEKNREALCVLEEKDRYNIHSVVASHSFSVEQREDMDAIANRLNRGLLKTDFNNDKEYDPLQDGYKCSEINQYQWEIFDVASGKVSETLRNMVINDYLSRTMVDLDKLDFRQKLIALGSSYSQLSTKKDDFIKEIISGEYKIRVRQMDMPDKMNIQDPMLMDLLNQVRPNITPKEYRCRVRVTRSGNLYLFRELT